MRFCGRVLCVVNDGWRVRCLHLVAVVLVVFPLFTLWEVLGLIRSLVTCVALDSDLTLQALILVMLVCSILH
jgi:hypothetical protein